MEKRRIGGGFRPPFPLWVLAGHAMLTAVVMWRLLPRLSADLYSHDQFAYPGLGGDEFPFLWMYWWAQRAAGSGQSIVFCDWIFPPTGANLTLRSFPYLPIFATYPIGWLWGPVAGNNVMVMGMLCLGASVYSFGLRYVLGLGAPASFIAGALFGFCPYFVWKAGGHYNLIGAYAWGAALFVYAGAALHNRYGWRTGALFALCLWAVFWTSLIEFFMLGICLALLTPIAEGAAIVRRKWTLSSRWAFLAPSVLGAPFLLYLLGAPPGQGVDVPLEAAPRLIDLIPSAKLSAFSAAGLPNRTEAVVPHSYAALFLAGLAVWRRERPPWAPAAAIVALTLLLFVVNAGGAPGYLVRSIPMGGGFRFMSRFIPHFFFFMLPIAALGCDGLVKRIRHGAGRSAVAAAAFLAVTLTFAAAELFPALMKTTEVPGRDLPAPLRESLDRSRFLLVVPSKGYHSAFDGFQVTWDMPAVHMTGWVHMDRRERAARAEAYPAVYGGRMDAFPFPNPPDVTSPTFYDELKALNVGYIVALKPYALSFEPEQVLYEGDDYALVTPP